MEWLPLIPLVEELHRRQPGEAQRVLRGVNKRHAGRDWVGSGVEIASWGRDPKGQGQNIGKATKIGAWYGSVS